MSPEKHDLKKGVDFIGITCVFYCHDGKGNILMQKRGQSCRDEQGRWDVGSGSMDFGEKDFETVVKREIWEEYKLRAKKISLAHVLNVHRKMENGTPTHWVAFIFVVEAKDIHKAKIGEPDKVEEIGLFPISKLPRPLHSKLRSHLEEVQRKGYL